MRTVLPVNRSAPPTQRPTPQPYLVDGPAKAAGVIILRLVFDAREQATKASHSVAHGLELMTRS